MITYKEGGLGLGALGKLTRLFGENTKYEAIKISISYALIGKPFETKG